MKILNVFFSACLVLILASSCIKEQSYDFNPTGDAYIEITRTPDSSSVLYRLGAYAFDRTYNQAISPASMTASLSGTVYPLTLAPYGYPTYTGDWSNTGYTFTGNYTFSMTRYSDGTTVAGTDVVSTVPAPSTPIVSIDSIIPVHDNYGGQGIGVCWQNVAGANFYEIEVRDMDGKLLFVNSFTVGTDYNKDFVPNINGRFVSDQTYTVKVNSVTYETGTNNYAYKTSSTLDYVWQ